MRGLRVAAAVLALSLTSAPHATAQPPHDFTQRFRGADRVAVGQVVETNSFFTVNPFGDHLIVTRARVAISETWKGERDAFLEIEVEGGSVGDLTLRVSDLPEVRQGQRFVVLGVRRGDGVFTPHLRGRGLIEVDLNGDAVDGGTSVGELRSAARAMGAQ